MPSASLSWAWATTTGSECPPLARQLCGTPAFPGTPAVTGQEPQGKGCKAHVAEVEDVHQWPWPTSSAQLHSVGLDASLGPSWVLGRLAGWPREVSGREVKVLPAGGPKLAWCCLCEVFSADLSLPLPSLEEDFITWREQFWPAVCEFFGVEATGEESR